jgi:serine/threonine protein phosphatase 1
MWNPLDRRAKDAHPELPPGYVVYAVGDIHGCSRLLGEAFEKIDADIAVRRPERAVHVFLGDYIDRGPDSFGVMEALAARAQSHTAVLLGGNHEAMLGRFLGEPATLPAFVQLGGLSTLLSYGVKPSGSLDEHAGASLAADFKAALPPAHREVLSSLRYTFTLGDYLFVHAGVRPNVPLSEQSPHDLLWIRDDFLLCEEAFEKFVVHGHTPVLEPDLRFNRANIDTGAFATGKLTTLVIDESGHRAI